MNDSFSVRYSPQALEDLRDLYTYLAFSLRVPSTAKQLVNRIRKTIRGLEQLPARYPRVEWEPWYSRGLRKMPIENFVVFYQIEEASSQVMILRIFYGGRNIETILSESK